MLRHGATETRCLAWLALALLAVANAGCWSLPKKPDTVGGPTILRDGVQPASYAGDDDADELGDDGVSLKKEEEHKTPGEIASEALSFRRWPARFRKLTGRGPDRDVSQQFYKDGEAIYKEAAAMQAPANQRKFLEAAAKFEEAALRWPDSALELDSLYMAGESYFFADQYPKANHTYERLIKAYPNNRYLDVVDQRRFAIAKYWIDLNRKHPEQMYYVNFFDDTRPWKDARGNGLRVYDKIRVDDPTGKLADDATLAAGNENFAGRKFLKADEYYTDLIKAYPNSEHQFTAHFLGLKAKLNSYLGPKYTSASLESAEKLIKQMRRQFPRESAQEREFLDRSMAEIRYKQAEKIYEIAQFYDKRAEYRAAQTYYAQAVEKFNDTPFASRAEERMVAIKDLPPVPAQKAQWLVDLLPETDEVKPLLEATRKYEEEQLQRETSSETMIASPPQDEVMR